MKGLNIRTQKPADWTVEEFQFWLGEQIASNMQVSFDLYLTQYNAGKAPEDCMSESDYHSEFVRGYNNYCQTSTVLGQKGW